MKWPAWLNPRNWLKRDMTVEQFAALGLYVPPVAGINLTPEAALGVSAVYCADRVISEDLASLPMLVYSGNRLDDESAPLFTHPVSRLLARPNPEMTGPVFWSQFQHNANLWGFALAEIAYDGAGRAAQLWPIPAPTARLDRVGGRLTFYAPGPNGREVELPTEDVLFMPGFSPDGSRGYKLLQMARQTLGMAVAVQRFGTSAFKNAMQPSGVIKHPGVLSPQAAENMRASWRALYAGVDNAAVPMILEEGTDWVKAELQHNDKLQLQQVMDFLVTEVARFFNVSPVKLHQLGRATWGNLETLQREHVEGCLGPWIAKRDAEIDVKLLRSGFHCRHIVDRLTRADTQTRYAAWNTAILGGWMTPNEARCREDMPPKPGGDDLRLPLNSAPATSPAATATPANATPAAIPPAETGDSDDGPDASDPPSPGQ